jgi:ABC-2 type transport system ATP-binding protein
MDLRLTAPPSAADLAGLRAVAEVSLSGTTVHLVVEGSVDPVIKAAARLDVVSIATREADLEDVFLTYYQDGSGRVEVGG